MTVEDKRLFTGIRLNQDVRAVLKKNANQLEQTGKIRLTREENFHLTLIYVGGTSREQDVRLALRELACEPFMVEFSEAGWFHRPEGLLIWQGVKVNAALADLHKQLNANLCWRGFCGPDLKYTPHITLGRRYRPNRNQHLETILPNLEIPPAMLVDSVSVFESRREDDQLVYEELERLELKKFE